MNKAADAFERLVDIMDELREKCPWDRRQTIQTLRQLTIEETYELADAVTCEDWGALQEELGDLLLHIVFYARIATEQGYFDLTSVIDAICTKLISRHPHVYGSTGDAPLVRNEEDVKKNWEYLKLKEGKSSVLAGVPRALPAMVKAMRLQEKAKQVNFEWKQTSDVWDKVKEEVRELEDAVQRGSAQHMEEEFGDLIFSLVNYARFLHIDAENALEKTNKKFVDRFTEMESAASARGKKLSEMTLAEMDALWNSAKLKNSID